MDHCCGLKGQNLKSFLEPFAHNSESFSFVQKENANMLVLPK